jgi:hypothetical protein
VRHHRRLARLDAALPRSPGPAERQAAAVLARLSDADLDRVEALCLAAGGRWAGGRWADRQLAELGDIEERSR